MNKILVILVTFLMIVTTMQSVLATDSSTVTINLCEKAVDIGNSWGVCDPSDSTKAQGIFTYNPSGQTLDFSASASGLTNGISYSLIYYKDTDPEHILASTRNVNILSVSTSNISGGVSFIGNTNLGNIPSNDDVNPKGKIWIVPTSEINSDYTLKWTGYANGATMNDYLFESDNIAQITGDELTVLQRMGGIIYTKAKSASDSLIGNVVICDTPTIGVDIAQSTISFGSLYPGSSSEEQIVDATITQTTQNNCGLITVPVTVEIIMGEWNTPEMSTSIDNPNLDIISISGLSIQLQQIGFVATAGLNAVPGTYSQTITFSATF